MFMSMREATTLEARLRVRREYDELKRGMIAVADSRRMAIACSDAHWQAKTRQTRALARRLESDLARLAAEYGIQLSRA